MELRSCVTDVDAVRVVVSAGVLRDVVARCVGSAVERVFFGIGVVEGGVHKVSEVFECPNISPTPGTRFVADPMCVYKLFRYAEARGMEIVLLIHSHPAPPNPSAEDLRGMRLWRIPWLIVSSLDGSYKVWILSNGELSEVCVEVIDPAGQPQP